MRMRKLGSGHSVLFFASGEIWRNVVAMRETCKQIKHNGVLWASQGLNFDMRDTAWEENSAQRLSAGDLSGVLQEQESRTLEELYGVKMNITPVGWVMAREQEPYEMNARSWA